MPAAPAGRNLGFQIGFQIGVSIVPAMAAPIVVAGLILLLGGVYYATARKEGATFRDSIFNWPLVIVAAIVAFLLLI